MCKLANTKMEDQSIKYALNQPNIDQTKFLTVLLWLCLIKYVNKQTQKLKMIVKKWNIGVKQK